MCCPQNDSLVKCSETFDLILFPPHAGVFDYDVTERSALAFRHFVGLIHSPPVQPGYKAFQKIVDEYLEKQPFNFTNPLRNMSTFRRVSP